MSGTRRLVVCALLSAGLGFGCGLQNSSGLKGAKHDIPVYPGAKIVDTFEMGFKGGDSFSSLESYDSVSWELTTNDPVEKVIAFYEAKLPGAEKTTEEVESDIEEEETEVDEETAEDEERADEVEMVMETTFLVVPDPTREDDHYRVTIRPGVIEIYQQNKSK